MASRMDKYHSSQVESKQMINSRSKKNEQLYGKLYTNKVFTEFTGAKIDNVIDISDISNNSDNRREQYQKNKMFNSNESVVSRDDYSANFDSLNYVDDKVEKNYNINDILEDAKKNRKVEDELEKKRRLKSVEYSILSDLSEEKLKEQHDNSQKLSKEEEENLEELIHTITSNSLRKKIDDELLTDLLPSEESETLISKDLFDKLEEIEEKNNELNEELEDENKIDDSFYTRSMELSRDDFDLEPDEADLSFLEEKKMGVIPKILIGLFILVVIGIIIYVVYRFV